MSAPAARPGARRRSLPWVLLVLLAVWLAVAFAAWWRGPALPEPPEPLAAALAVPEGPQDLDRSVQALLETDALLADAGGLDEFLSRARLESEAGVSPRLLAVRRLLLERLIALRQATAEVEARARLWDWTRTAFAALQSVRLELLLSGAPGLGVESDPARAERARQAYDAYLEGVRAAEAGEQAGRAELARVLVAWNELAQGTLQAWDRACVARDLAAVALRGGQPQAAAEHARRAAALAPGDVQGRALLAHALLEAARARLEGQALEAPPAREPGAAVDPGGAAAHLAEARAVLGALLAEHPEQSAPGLLLEGALAELEGRADDAQLAYQAALLQYPRQAERLGSRLHPLRWRARLLARSSAGLGALALQRDMLQGAGDWSPELRLAGLRFARGEAAAGRAELLSHFARRRAQGTWDDLLADLAACYRRFGEHFRRIFPEESFLELEVERSLLGGKLAVAVRNRGDRDLPNASLVLCLRFTDMLPEDHATFALPTRPLLGAGEAIDFGPFVLPEGFQVAGRPKTLDDAILSQLRAVLVSDHAVVWVDTRGFREAALEEARGRRARGERAPEPPPGWLDGGPGAFAGARARLEEGLLRDEVRVELPRSLAELRPVFRLRPAADPAGAPPREVRLEGERILLAFPAPKPLPEELELLVAGPFADLTLILGRLSDGGYRFSRLAR